MATRTYIESLNIEDNVFELQEDTEINYLVHFLAPFTGSSQIIIPKGTKFAPHSSMRDDAMYMHPIEPGAELKTRLDEQEQKHYENLADRIQGYSFYITEEEIKIWNINFISGSRESLLETLRLIRESNHKR